MPTAEERYDWPIRGRFRKKYQPYAVRVCEETIDEIAEYDDCRIMRDEDGDPLGVEVRTTEGSLDIGMKGWVAEDSQGEHYPVSHDEFRRMYEPID
jgi:hypothetical protein